LSLDGTRMAFFRKYLNGEMALIVSHAFDGSGERKLATRLPPKSFWPTSPAWSPDGNSIICVNANSLMDSDKNLVQVSVTDGTEKVISSQTWAAVGSLKWLADGSGLILLGCRRWADPIQLWAISYPAGEVERITNDSGDYGEISITADATALVTTNHSTVRHV